MKKQLKYIISALIMIFLSSILTGICLNNISLLEYTNYNYVIEAKEKTENLPKTEEIYKFEHPVYRGEQYEIIHPIYRGEPIEFKFLNN